MKGFAFLILVLIWSITGILAQNKDYDRLFKYAKNTPKYKSKNIQSLSKYLIKGTKSKKELAELIYYWISLNIDYDVVSFQHNININVSAENTFKNKKSVCAGYANLYKTLCDKVGLECNVINGYAKGYGYDSGIIFNVNHSWNVVKIKNKWELIDATWGAGYVEMQNDSLVFIRELNLRYLFDNPEDFILDHFPEDPKWQLLKKRITIEDYNSHEMEVKRLNRMIIKINE